MHIDFGEFGVTTWRLNEQGEQVWRARWGDTVVEFVADRGADNHVLRERGLAALHDDMYPPNCTSCSHTRDDHRYDYPNDCYLCICTGYASE